MLFKSHTQSFSALATKKLHKYQGLTHKMFRAHAPCGYVGIAQQLRQRYLLASFFVTLVSWPIGQQKAQTVSYGEFLLINNFLLLVSLTFAFSVVVSRFLTIRICVETEIFVLPKEKLCPLLLVPLSPGEAHLR